MTYHPLSPGASAGSDLTNAGLNKAQKKAAMHCSGPMLVIAGPGSGKTTVLIEHILFLIFKLHVPAGNILITTFSKAAAEEIKSRFFSAFSSTGSEAYTDSCYNMSGKEVQDITFGTIHSIAFHILKYSFRYRNINILNEADKRKIIITGLEKHNIDHENDAELPERIINEISRIKNNGLDIETYVPYSLPPEVFRQVFNNYENERHYLKKADYDDILNLCLKLLETDPESLKKCRDKYRYILVDEFQDINPVQYQIIRLLSGNEKNIFAVGDDDQSIYGFRGSCPGIMKQFIQDFRNCKTVLLNINYRSKKTILNKALQLISVNKNRFDKPLYPGRRSGTDSVFLHSTDLSVNKDVFSIKGFRTRTEEAVYISAKIKGLLESGISPCDIAVLFRNSFDSDIFINEMLKKNIPVFSNAHAIDPLSHFIARDVSAYMKLASGTCSRKDFLRIMNRPSRYISRDAVDHALSKTGTINRSFFSELNNYYRGNRRMNERIMKLQHDLEFISGCTPFSAIRYITLAAGYKDYLSGQAKENMIRPDNYNNILEEITESAKDFSSFAQWFDHIERKAHGFQAAGSSYQISSHSSSSADCGNGIRIMTIHAAKGLEFDTVFIPCVIQGTIPHRKAKTKTAIEEERRLMYVAMTRAKNRLFISWSETVKNKHTQPSEFLDSIF